MKRLGLLSLTLTVMLLATACRREAEAPGRARPVGAAPAQSADQFSALGVAAGDAQRAVPAAPPSAEAAKAEAPQKPDFSQLQSSLKLIRTASVQIEVKDFKAAVEEATRAASSFGGYVSDQQMSEDGASIQRGQITLRVPADRFDGAISALKKIGRVKSEAVSAQDVTKAYADLETRLKVKRETAARLREILIRQTGKVSEVLEVEREIARVLEEIEQAEGERRYYDNLISLSTITLTLYEPGTIVASGAFDPVINALRDSMRVASESLAALIELFAGLLPWLVALYVIYRLVRARFRRRA